MGPNVIPLGLIGLLLFVEPILGQCPGTVCPLPNRGWRASPRPPVTSRTPAIPPAIVRVGCHQPGSRSYATGTIILRSGKSAYVLTCAHLLGAQGTKARAYAIIKGNQYEARVEQVDRIWDIALLRIADPGIAPVDLAESTPKQGETIRLMGFGTGSYRQIAGQMLGFAAPAETSRFQLLRVSVGSRDGDSGGPMLNSRGKLVGVISSTNGRETYGCCLPRLRQMLRVLLAGHCPQPGIADPRTPPKSMPEKPSEASALTGLCARLDRLEQTLELFARQLEKLQAVPGPQGPPGPQGLSGSTPRIDYDLLAKRLIERLEPITVRAVRPDGGIIREVRVPLGGTLDLKLYPLNPRTP